MPEHRTIEADSCAPAWDTCLVCGTTNLAGECSGEWSEPPWIGEPDPDPTRPEVSEDADEQPETLLITGRDLHTAMYGDEQTPPQGELFP